MSYGRLLLLSVLFVLTAGAPTLPSAGEPDATERGAKTESDRPPTEPTFTWRRDRPYGELGFLSGEFAQQWEFVRLVTHKPVQEVLELSPEQIEQLRAAHERFKSAPEKGARGGQDSLQAAYDQARCILTEEQALRVEQIQFQRRGVQAFLHTDAQTTLDLKPKQIETIRAAWTAHLAKAKQGWKGDEGRQSYHRVWKLALETLTEAQRRKLYQLTGALVDRPLPRPVQAARPHPAPAQGRLPPYLEQVIGWLPPDTETLIVARDFELKHHEAVGPPDMPVLSLQDAAQHAALGPLLEFDNPIPSMLRSQDRRLPIEVAGEEGSCLLKELAERRVAWAVFAGRNFEAVEQDEAMEGRYRYEGCSIIEFADPLGQGGEVMMKRLRRLAAETWRVSDQEILVFPRRPFLTQTVFSTYPSQGIFLAQLSPSRLLIANHDVFLYQVLRRRQAAEQASDARLSTLPPLLLGALGQVEQNALAWSVRGIPERLYDHTDLRSIVWSCQVKERGVFQATVTARRRSDEKVEQESPVRYLGPLAHGEPTADVATFIVQDNQMVTVTLPLDQAKSADSRWMTAILHLRGAR